MNFLLLRSNQTAAPEKQAVDPNHSSNLLSTLGTLGGLIAAEPQSESTSTQNHEGDGDEFGGEISDAAAGLSGNNKPLVVDNHVDVNEDEGWISIPYKEIPANWREAPNIDSFHSMDRSFVFPGEQVHILACLSASKQQDIQIITPFKVAALMKTCIGYGSNTRNGNMGNEVNFGAQKVDGVAGDGDKGHNGNTQNEFSSGESLLRMEDRRRQTERLLERFDNSHFFVRIAESDEPLWSTKGTTDSSRDTSSVVEQNLSTVNSQKEYKERDKKKSSFSAVVDRGYFDSSTSGGVARGAVKCCALQNGDLVVLLQINVGDAVLRDPVLEILQFERYQENSLLSKRHKNLVSDDHDPCGQLLRWIIPLDNSFSPPRPSSPPPVNMTANIRSASIKPTLSASSSQLFSFSHFRSYSMSSLPPNANPPQTSTPTSTPVATPTVAATNSKTPFDPEDWDRFSFQNSLKSEKTGDEGEGFLSFRGVTLEPERFSVQCGLEGIYVPGMRWRKKIEIIQPVEIKSFAADCNTDDLLYVQIKNVSPSHAPHVVVYIDAITIVSEDASKGGLPSPFPIACIEAGQDYSLPNLALRRGEEHSFVLKPAILAWKDRKVQGIGNPQLSHSMSSSSSNDGNDNVPDADQYAVLVSCRCNYTESRLFFKKPTSWRPRISRNLMISVASEMATRTSVSDGQAAQLPVQVLSLQACNLTSEELTLTVLAPASFTSPPTVVSLSSSPSSPVSPFFDSAELTERAIADKRSMHKRSSSSALTNEGQEGEGGTQSVMYSEQAVANVLPNGDLGCTHLWLQSKVPLGCVPPRSTATIKLEVLPLTDGIITLDSLQIGCKEKGVTHIPEHSLKINATSSISTRIN